MTYAYGTDELRFFATRGCSDGLIVGLWYDRADDLGNIGYSLNIPSEDAPALALTVLESAGYGKTEAAGFVRGQVEALAEKAEREAEDSQVAEFRKASDPGNHFEWHELKPEAHDAWRKRYRAARRFFEGS